MRFLRKILGFFNGEEGADAADDGDREGADVEEDKRRAASSASASGLGNRKGFSVQVPVPGERSYVGPLLVACDSGDGGVQVEF